ncbi:hypothetical protein P3X46_016501 [Hevea brasiliensis]|nr:uncharacterized protein LOC110656562 isoform X1 [Hevea brasiliensis]KAJ9173356.1 hypothetical protein P3X46_016501 [Hevea brasiliensis]
MSFYGKRRFKYFLHRHDLEHLEKEDVPKGVFCKGCNRHILGHAYSCSRCEFYLHPSCAELLQEINHFFHQCVLTLKIFSSSFTCNACYQARSGFAYVCETCRVNFDPECVHQLSTMKSEDGDGRIEHFSHHHPLKDYEAEALCHICGQLCSGPAWGCSQCNFYLHKYCMKILPRRIKHWFHSCPLTFLTLPDYRCVVCLKTGSGLIFRCLKCRFELCVECCLMSVIKSNRSSKHPGEIQHFFHSCPLILKISSSFTCNGCLGHRSDFTYWCQHCDFYLDLMCARTFAIKSEGEEKKIQHFSHWHPLEPFEKMEDYEVLCVVCGNPSSDPTYCCSRCKFYIHKSCMDTLPQKIQRFFHPCPLILLNTPHSYQCAACDENCLPGLTFCCGNCHFQLDTRCALQPMIKYEGQEKIKHISHVHPLTLYPENNVHHEVCCKGCEKNCSILAYGCSNCNFYLHKSCAELPLEIMNSYHPAHPLILLNVGSQNLKKVKCNFCLKECGGFVFRCGECNFNLDVDCAFLKPTVEFMKHSHLLTVVDNIYGELECCACNRSCISSPAFRCLECDYNLHLVCGPLPVTIKHKCHIDPLTLKDFYVEDEDDDDEFYCDACEERRDPKLCVYYCEIGCPMIVEVKCVLSVVIPALRGERGDVKLRTAVRQITSKVISKELMVTEMKQNEAANETREGLSFDDIFHSLNASEKNEINDIIERMQKKMKRGKESVKGKEKDGTHPALFTSEAFRRFMDCIDAHNICLWKQYKQGSSSLKTKRSLLNSAMILNGPSVVLGNEFPSFLLEQNEFVKIGDVLLSPTLNSIYMQLLGRFRDDDIPGLSPKVGSLILYILCGVIQNMSTTKVVDVTEHKLGEWVACLKWAECAGFKIQFLFRHIKRVARVHYVFRARKLLDSSEVEHQQEIERTREEVEKLRTKMEAATAKFQLIEEHKKSRTAREKQFLKKTPLAMQWKPAADGLFDIVKDHK